MRSQLVIISALLLFLLGCDQAPTTLEEEPYNEPILSSDFTLDIIEFDFDYLSHQFFFSVAIMNPPLDANFHAELISSGLDPVVALAPLNDGGINGDIQVNDGFYDGNWILPEESLSYVDSSWTLTVYTSNSATSATHTIQPQRPRAPEIVSVSHRDTLTLESAALVLDTLSVTVTHPHGLDEIRDVSMMSLKPDGSYANNGQPIPLYDDGGSEVFFTFNEIDFTSGDSIAGDGIYSLLLALTPTNLSGTYQWTFTARSWLGIDSETFEDSLIVLPAVNLSRGNVRPAFDGGVFQ